MSLPRSGAKQAEDHLDGSDHDKVKDPDAHADGQGAKEHGTGVLRDGLPVGPDDLLQFAFHFAEPLSAALSLLDFFMYFFSLSFTLYSQFNIFISETQ